MVFGTLVVKSIELCNSGVGRDDVGVSQEAPNLSQSHGERLLRLDSLDLPGVILVPSLKLGVVPEQNILNFFHHILWVLLKLDQVRNVDKFSVRIFLNLSSRFRNLKVLILGGACGILCVLGIVGLGCGGLAFTFSWLLRVLGLLLLLDSGR